MNNSITRIPRLIWGRLPHITAYALALIGILFMLEFAYYRYSDGVQFINYSKFNINTAEEHTDVPFEACKDAGFPYKATGNLTVYRIPDGAPKSDKVVAEAWPLDTVINVEDCVSGFITRKRYDFTPGNYQIYITLNFTVKYGNQKEVTIKSNIFQIIPDRPASVEEIEAKIIELERQIELLKLQLEEARSNVSTSVTLNSSPDKQTTTNQPNSPPSNQPNPQDPPSNPPEQPQPSLLEQIAKPVNDLLDSLRKGLGRVL